MTYDNIIPIRMGATAPWDLFDALRWIATIDYNNANILEWIECSSNKT